VEVPTEAAQMIQPKAGYKNYFFNELNRNRIWNRITSKGDWTAAAGSWKLTGQLAAGGELSVTLADETSELEWPGARARVTETTELSGQLDPADTGLLLALHLWRRALLLGPARYGEVVYQGEAPLTGHDGRLDVLAATRDVTLSLLYFEPSAGRLAAIEVFHDSQVDPCELVFDDYRSAGGVELPHRILARRGAQPFAELRITQFTINR
jgi:hypothetical protein